MRDQIFISYRRDDARGASGRLYDWLRIAFGRDRVFRDVYSIGIGNWRAKIDAALVRSSVFVAVIGPRWVNADNLARLHDESDMVRYEVLRALADNEVTLVPTLVEGGVLPEADILPAELRPMFALWNARQVSEDGWETDIRRLIAEIAEATHFPVDADLDRLLSFPGATHQRMVQSSLRTDQIDALYQTIDELTRKLAEASPLERPERAAAIDSLARGDSLAAEKLFENDYVRQSRVANDSRQRTAEAARSVANLALLRDVSKAVSFYRKALEADPDHGETARLLGYALMLAGDVTEAKAAMSRSLDACVARRDSWGEMAARIGLGNVLVAQGDGPGALATYRESLALGEALAARDPANPLWQRDLSVSHQKIGDVLVAQEDGPGALAAYRKSLAISEALAARDPANTQWQRDLSVSHNKIGNVYVAQGDEPGALAAYRKDLAIAEALAARDPANTEWQRDLSVSHNKIGNVLVAQGDGPGALAAYRKGLAIREALAAGDPANAQAQVDVAVSCANLGLINYGQDLEQRRRHLVRGREILQNLKSTAKLLPNQDWIGWFDEQLDELG